VDHPVRGEPIVGFVSRRGTKKLSNLREHSRVTVVFRSEWEWVAVEGDAELAGPDDPLEGFAAINLPQLLRNIYAAALEETLVTGRAWTQRWLRKAIRMY
jgi:hypothetical protein